MANGTLVVVVKFPELDLAKGVLASEFSRELVGAGEDLGSLLESVVVGTKGVVPADLAASCEGRIGGSGGNDDDVGTRSRGEERRADG